MLGFTLFIPACDEIQTAYGGAAPYVPATAKRERDRRRLAGRASDPRHLPALSCWARHRLLADRPAGVRIGGENGHEVRGRPHSEGSRHG